MNRLSITLNEKSEIDEIKLIGSFTSGTFLKVATDLFRISVENLLDKASETPGYNEEESKKDRAYMYDYIVVFLSDLANKIYPENQELGPTPEEFLAELDKKVKELKEIEQK